MSYKLFNTLIMNRLGTTKTAFIKINKYSNVFPTKLGIEVK